MGDKPMGERWWVCTDSVTELSVEPRFRRALAVAVVASSAVIGACGSGRDAGDTVDPTAGAASVAPSVAPAETDSIPTDPARLPSCDEYGADEMAATPSRRWPGVADGWTVRYAYTTRDPARSSGARWHWSTLVQVTPDDTVTAMVVINAHDSSDSPEGDTTVRGVPASLGPEVSRSGPTGAVEASWMENGLRFVATGRGVDASGLRTLAESLDLTNGVVSAPPDGWLLLGAASSAGSPDVTVLGLTGDGGSLLEAGDAPIEVVVDETAAGEPAPGALRTGLGFDVASGTVSVAQLDARPALVVDLGDGRHLVITTTSDGLSVTANGSATAPQLLALASGMIAIGAEDPRLMGVPMGNVASSPGRWCRTDR
jgi:hypothetical protein